MSPDIDDNPWTSLRRFTRARIALGRAGNGLPTAAWLAFDLAHAQARDAVHRPLDADALHAQLRHGCGGRPHETIDVGSAAPDRAHYLRRPDLGRQLSDEGRDTLAARAVALTDVVFVVADGLSAFAAERHAVPLLDALLPQLGDWRVGPVVVARQARVALGDEVGEVLGAAFVVVLIGERPGLSSPDSLGIYLTHAPRVGCSDAQRNCISNVRPEGLAPVHAAHRLFHLMTQARRLGLTGVGLKDNSGGDLLDATGAARLEAR